MPTCQLDNPDSRMDLPILFQRSHPDVVLLDLVLSDGQELAPALETRIFRARMGRFHLPTPNPKPGGFCIGPARGITRRCLLGQHRRLTPDSAGRKLAGQCPICLRIRITFGEHLLRPSRYTTNGSKSEAPVASHQPESQSPQIRDLHPQICELAGMIAVLQLCAAGLSRQGSHENMVLGCSSNHTFGGWGSRCCFFSLVLLIIRLCFLKLNPFRRCPFPRLLTVRLEGQSRVE